MDCLISILIVGCIFVSGAASESDPCTSYEPLPRATYRGGQCEYVQDKAVCDVYLDADTWYQAQGLNGYLTMQTSAADFFKCGTKFPIWMNGTHPSVAEGEVERQGCHASLRSSCFESVTIKVKNCGSFYVYKMPPTGSCPEGYCFGETETCPPFDPCDFYEHTTIDYEATRSSSCDVNDVSSCDRLANHTWYKFQGETHSTFLTVASSCPSGTTCGTESPLWIQGILYDFPNGTSIGAGCVKSGDDCCSQLFRLHTKQCSRYTVYRFIDDIPRQCHRFCTDDPSSVCAVSPNHTGAVSSTYQSTRPTTGDLSSLSNSTMSSTNATTGNQESLKNDDLSWLEYGGVGFAVGVVLGIVATVLTCLICCMGRKSEHNEHHKKLSAEGVENNYDDLTPNRNEDNSTYNQISTISNDDNDTIYY